MKVPKIIFRNLDFLGKSLELKNIYLDVLYLWLHKEGKDLFASKGLVRDDKALTYCIANSLLVQDIHNKKPKKTQDEYILEAILLGDFHEFIELGYLIIENHKNKQYDTSFSLEEKKETLRNSIRWAVLHFGKFSNQDDYWESELKSEHTTIIEDIYTRIKDPHNKQWQEITKKLENLKLNFYLNMDEDNNFIIYPIIADILLDVFIWEYYAEIDKKDLQEIKNVYFSMKNLMSKGLISAKPDTKIKFDFFQNVSYAQVRKYILYAQAKMLDIDVKEYRKLFKEVLFYDMSQHGKALALNFKLKFNKTEEHFPLILETSKFVI